MLAINTTNRNPSINRYLCLLTLCVFANTLTMADEMQEVMKGNNDFAGKLYQAVANHEKSGNIFISPISAHTILSLVYQGSGGQTEKTLSSTLNVPNKLETAVGYKKVMAALQGIPDVTLNIANKIFLQKNFKLRQEFVTMAVDSYKSGAEELDFKENVASANTINAWVENQTNKKIKDLISADMLDAMTRLVLVNAIYFKGNWATQFKKEHTTKKPFYTSETESHECDMMFLKSKFRYTDNSDLDAQILELPYVGGQMSMLVILPKNRTGIAALEQKLANVDMSTLTQNMWQTEVEVQLPKFKIEYTTPLTKILKAMGLGVMFSDGADFHGLSETPLKVSDAIQKAFIEVNEEGTEAAAATALLFAESISIPRRPVQFRADHPFIFLLAKSNTNENSFSTLFLGRIVQKLSE